MTFFDKKKSIAKKILATISCDGLLQASPLASWLQEARTVNSHTDNGFYTPRSGTFVSKKTKKEMQYESGNECAVLEALEAMPEANWFDTQCIKFPYQGAEDEYEYTPDIVCRFDNDQIVIIEAKPAKDVCLWKNYRKYVAGRHLCAKNDWHYMVLSSKEGTIEDMRDFAVTEATERGFMYQLSQKPTGRFGGMRWKDVEEFKQSYGIKNDRTVTAIALRNDLTFYDDGPKTWTRLREGCSWDKIFRQDL